MIQSKLLLMFKLHDTKKHYVPYAFTFRGKMGVMKLFTYELQGRWSNKRPITEKTLRDALDKTIYNHIYKHEYMEILEASLIREKGYL